MRLYQRGSKGTFYYDFFVNGKRVQGSTKTADEKKAKREAERARTSLLLQVERGDSGKVAKISLVELNKRYIEYAKAHQKRSWVRDEQMQRHFERILGPVMLHQIGGLKLEEYQRTRLDEKVCPATVNREMSLLRREFSLAERWGFHRGTNPVRLVDFFKEERLERVTISREDELALLKHSPAYLQDMILFALNTGLRCGDIFDLKWEEVDVEARRIARKMQKSQKMLRAPLNDKACEILKAWAAVRKCPYVFYNQLTGDRFRDLKASLSKAVKDAGLERITWHIFRHTFVSRLFENGTDIATVKELAGHSTVTITIGYAHPEESTKRNAVAKIATSERPEAVIPARRRTKSARVTNMGQKQQ
jgi:integrase